ncbi:MAG: hypothetical protein GY913_36255 [Proteobacteria bacterium]|nr:hypothetical protein [Pseudomonadota bacterium]MCP4922385.1 hypothetical protein [Pseudomonadota bacterium]
MNRRVFIRVGGGLVAASALGGGGYTWWKRKDAARVSEKISSEWPEIGVGFWILPNLKDAFMRIPDRPHSMEEAMNKELLERITRTRDFLVNSNANRLRGGPIQTAPAYRIACLGDSVTFGWGVEDDEAWPAVLQRQLVAQGIDAECLNVGVPAQSVEAMSAWLQKIGPSMDLNAFVICERRSQMDTTISYSQHIRDARFALPNAKCMVALPPISRFDLRGRQNRYAEFDEIAPYLRGMPVIDLTDAIWNAQPDDEGHDLVIDGQALNIVEKATGEVILEAGRDEMGGLHKSVYHLFETDHSIREPLMFDGGHPDAEGFIPFARAIGDLMIEEGWFG